MKLLMCCQFPPLPGMYVVTGVENEMPLFNRIDSIIVKDNSAYLLICKVSNNFFDDHLNAFGIGEKNEVFTVICVNDLVYYRPCDRQFSYDTDDQVYLVLYCNYM